MNPNKSNIFLNPKMNPKFFLKNDSYDQICEKMAFAKILNNLVVLINSQTKSNSRTSVSLVINMNLM